MPVDVDPIPSLFFSGLPHLVTQGVVDQLIGLQTQESVKTVGRLFCVERSMREFANSQPGFLQGCEDLEKIYQYKYNSCTFASNVLRAPGFFDTLRSVFYSSNPFIKEAAISFLRDGIEEVIQNVSHLIIENNTNVFGKCYPELPYFSPGLEGLYDNTDFCIPEIKEQIIAGLVSVVNQFKGFYPSNEKYKEHTIQVIRQAAINRDNFLKGKPS